MKQTYSQSQLIEMAKERFAKLQVNKLFATSDGSFFLLENRARLHVGPKGNVFELNNENDIPGDDDAVISIKELKLRLATATELQEVTDMMLREVGGKNRATAVQAIQVRLDELTAPAAETDQEKKLKVIQELTKHGLDFDEAADIDSLKTILDEFLAKAEPSEAVTPLDLTGNVEAVKLLVQGCEDKAVLTATETAETAGAKRKGVIQAIANRLVELG